MNKCLVTSVRLAALLISSVFLFSCSSSDDPAAPVDNFTVVENFPANGATNVPVGTNIWARFSAAVNPSTLTADQTFMVSNTSGTSSGDDRTGMYFPEDPLETAQTYTITLTTGVTRSDGKPLNSAHSWSFTTESVAVARPTVVSVTPADGATEVDPTTTITATFDRSLNPASVVAGQSFVVTGVMGSVQTTDNVAVFTPDDPLPSQTIIEVSLTTAIQDTDGAAMANPFHASFETAFVVEPWEQTYGQPTIPFREKTYFSHVVAESDDSYYGFGVDNVEAYVVKTDAQGDEVWSRTFGTAISYKNEAFVVLDDGCIFAYASQTAGVEVVRLNGNGATQVETTISGDGALHIYDMIEARDGNFVMAGVNPRFEDSVPLMTFWTAKIDASGTVLWQHAYPDSVDINEVTGMVETSDGGFMIMGSNQGIDGRGIAMRTDSSGERLWVKKLEGTLLARTPYSMVRASDDGYILAGTYLQGSDAEGFVAKIDEDADVVWSYRAGDHAADWDPHLKFMDLVAVPGGYVAAGMEGPAWNIVDAVLVMFDASGNFVWKERIGGPRNEYLRSVTVLSGGEFLAAGYTNAFSANMDYYMAYMLKHVPAGQ